MGASSPWDFVSALALRAGPLPSSSTGRYSHGNLGLSCHDVQQDDFEDGLHVPFDVRIVLGTEGTVVDRRPSR